MTLRRRVVIVLAFAGVVGCAAILGREDIVLEEEEMLRPDASEDGATGSAEETGGAIEDAPPGDVSTTDAGDAAPACPAVDASCDTDAAADAGCCPGLECRNSRCSTCVAVSGSCSGGGVRCCGSAVCSPSKVCVACLEAGAQCPITDSYLCCSKSCSPTDGCF